LTLIRCGGEAKAAGI